MSWEAVTWANKQRLKKSYEQIVLLVLANAADPNGEAFVKWPGRDHWWSYLSDLTRLPKSSLFRHLNTLMALGLGERSMLVLADGTRRPTFTLNMSASFDISNPEDEARYNAVFAKASPENESPVETEHHDDETGAEYACDISGSHGTEASVVPESPVGTEISEGAIPSGGTGSFPVLGTHRDSKPLSKDSPLPPSGGLPARDELWERFIASWGEPIPKMALTRSAWDHAETAKRAEIVTAARGYWAWLKGHTKPPTPLSAQSFIRNSAGWAQWLRYAPDDDGVAPPITAGYPRASVEARALINLHEAFGVSEGFRKINVRDVVTYRKPMTDQIRAFAEMPPRSEWVQIDRKGAAAAWGHFAREASTLPRPRLFREGDLVPWIFPPSATGKLYSGPRDDPPQVNDEDWDALASEGEQR